VSASDSGRDSAAPVHAPGLNGCALFPRQRVPFSFPHFLNIFSPVSADTQQTAHIPFGFRTPIKPRQQIPKASEDSPYDDIQSPPAGLSDRPAREQSQQRPARRIKQASYPIEENHQRLLKKQGSIVCVCFPFFCAGMKETHPFCLLFLACVQFKLHFRFGT
jgi:hypothetical protein